MENLQDLIIRGRAVRGVRVRWILYGTMREGEVQCLNPMGMAIVLSAGAEYPVNPANCEVIGQVV